MGFLAAVPLLAILGNVRPALAVPAIQSVEGTLAHGGTLVISGSGFGAKDPAAPFFWSNLEGHAVNSVPAVQSVFSGVWAAADCTDWRPMFKDSGSNRWVAPPHGYSTVLLGMGNKDNYPANHNCRNAMVSVIDRASTHPRWYALYYTRYSADFQKYPPSYGQSSTSFDFSNYAISLNGAVDATQTSVTVAGSDYDKIGANDVLRIDSEKVQVVSREGTRLTVRRGHLGTTGAPHAHGASAFLRGNLFNQKSGLVEAGTNVPFASYQSQVYGLTHKNQSSQFDLTIDGGGGVTTCAPCGQEERTLTGTDVTQGWKHVELIVKDDAPGFAKTLVDNSYSQNCTCANPAEPLATSHNYNGFSFGTFLRGGYPEGVSGGTYHCNSNSWTYLDDVYVDTTFSRVILANSASYAYATILEPQIPSFWSDGSITVAVNLGRIPAETAYLFVFDSGNNPNITGYRLSLTGTPPPLRPPVIRVLP